MRLVNERMLVEVGGVVGTRHDHPLDARLEGRPVDVARHAHVFEFHFEGINATLAAETAGALVAQVHDRVDAVEQMRVLGPVGIDQIRDFDTRDFAAIAVLPARVRHSQVVSLAEFGAQLRRDVTAGAR